MQYSEHGMMYIHIYVLCEVATVMYVDVHMYVVCVCTCSGVVQCQNLMPCAKYGSEVRIYCVVNVQQ